MTEAIRGKLLRRYKAGYEIREETHQNGHEYTMKRAYTPDGKCIGDPKTAYRLCKKIGIVPTYKRPDSNICSIGFCERDRKWYGWSHRAIFGFGVGSHVGPGDCGYEPKDKEDFRLDCIRFWASEYYVQTKAIEQRDEETGELGVYASWLYNNTVPNEKLRGGIGGVFTPYPEAFGRGEWTAETLDDAKQMAVAFADGVS